MIRCERCGTGFSPIQAAVLAFCPRCRARDQVKVPLLARLVKEAPDHHAKVDHREDPRPR
jgi:predicted  nucleic acid-binding Zn-ribbon protein